MQPSRCAARSFDFSGSGLSDGEFVSLGWWEREDLAAVIEYLEEAVPDEVRNAKPVVGG